MTKIATTTKTAPAKEATTPTRPDRMLKLMSRTNGVSIDEALKAMPMQLHSLRALVSTVAKTHSLTVKFNREARRYRIIKD